MAAARELAADRRELRRDADAAIAKLRGGQPVAELEALESRAETLEESETGAALSHAEDDRLFMRGFAQRPPAEQAARIAAMENGPEPKPVETRRLAAMQAQAAVTERALAKDPLAYAQSTGVIGEPADIADLSPEALRARLRQAETAAEQFGLPSAPLLRPGEAAAVAEKLAKGTPEELQAKAEELADLPAEIRQAAVEEIGPKLPPEARNALDPAADSETEGAADQEALVSQAVAALLQGAPLEAVQRGLRERGVDPTEFGAVPDGREFDQLSVTEGPDGQVRVFGTRGDTLEDLGLFGKGRSAITRAETLRGLGPDNAFRDLVPTEDPGDPAPEPDLRPGPPELPDAILVQQGDGKKELVQIKPPLALATGPELFNLTRPGGGNLLARGAFVAEKLGATVDFDESGNLIAVFPGGERFAVNEPGPSAQDLTDAAVEAFPAVVGGGVARLGKKALGLGISLGGRALTEGARDLRGTTDPLKQAIEGFAETGGEALATVEPQQRKFLLNFLSSPAFFDDKTGRLTDAGGQAMADAGIDPRLLTPRFIGDFKRVAIALEDSESRSGSGRSAVGGRRALLDPQSLKDAALAAANAMDEPLAMP